MEKKNYEYNLDFIDLFLDKLYTEKNLTKNTLKSYKKDLIDLLFFLNKKNYKIDNCNEDSLSKYIKLLNTKRYEVTTLTRKISVIKQFFYFLSIEKYRDDDPASQLSSPKIKSSLPKILTEKDLQKIFAYLYKNKEPFKNFQILVLTELLYATGLRVSELVTLKKSSITENFEHIYVKGKGNKERVIPLGETVKNLLKDYLGSNSYKNLKTYGEMWLFPSRKSHITRQSYYYKLKNAAACAGLNAKFISPHILRHAFASHMLKNGADLKVIQYFLGHEDISTVQIYTHVNLKESVKAIKRHPISNFSIKG